MIERLASADKDIPVVVVTRDQWRRTQSTLVESTALSFEAFEIHINEAMDGLR